ncbi:MULTISPECIES: 2-hydroxychromene-2-carboxylate isomerase [Ramlibacter]|uniref:2-hydroxychromene-2-carboxylate isomerase n=1 Tax=Ramlibacter aquaticus TaxID=2780094 RepID=A0ABR9SGT2_9BURK|nr:MULTISPECIES: 2-hydroxychromene-2-carboxylate isomerase [Ramlibacter]MBE7941523.1 2-hydroxychromene-2-carboxylate isomerase [Ramlibacter aquaticus]
MAEPLHFHFDFISPYGWFASTRIEAIAARHGRTVEWHPMLLGVAVMKVMGLKPLLDTPLKGDYVRRDVKRHARRLGLALGRDPDAPVGSPLPMARALSWVRRHDPARQAPLVHALYDAYWGRGQDLSTPAAVAAALPADWDRTAAEAAIAGDQAAAWLREDVQASLDSGVFGSPTTVVDGEPFWGLDRLPEVDAWLQTGGW